MPRQLPTISGTYTVDEIARAAGVTAADVRGALGDALRSTPFVGHEEAVALVRALRSKAATPSPRTAPEAGAPVAEAAVPREAPLLFAGHHRERRASVLPTTVSGAVHATLIVAAAALAGMSSSAGVLATTVETFEPVRMVYLVLPGPGGGGGGGTRSVLPAPRAALKGPARTSSPAPAARPTPAPVPVAAPQAERPLPSEPMPPVVIAPVIPVPGDGRDRIGVLTQTPSEADSRGTGSGSGVGSGHGTGVGEGTGPGIGPGSGGGTGGGVYGPGSGVTPPTILREVRPTYTEEARARGVTGEVLLQVVVKADGSVGTIRLVRGLGFGLDERAIAATRQWRFAPAKRLGVPVDVAVEVAVEFRLR